VLSVGAAVRRDGDGSRVMEARIVLGAVASAPVRACEAERALAGRDLDEEAIAAAAEAAAGPSRPMDNTDFSFLWRKEMTRKWVSAALRQLARTARASA
jgi:CO/xanthine dehydrogenase FAD-binding subunit